MYSSILTEQSFVTISLLSDFSSRLAEKVIQVFKYTQKCFTNDCISFQLYLALAFVTICTFALLHCLRSHFGPVTQSAGGSVAEWLACWGLRRRRPEFKSQPRRCRVTVLGKVLTPIVPLFAKQRNWWQPSKGAWVTAGLTEVMAAYRQVYDSRHLQAHCHEPGSAPEPFAR